MNKLIKIAILGDKSQEIFSAAKKLVSDLEVELKNQDFEDFEPEITVITDLENQDVLEKTKSIIIANLEDKEVAGVIKNLMKEIPVTVIDYNKHIIDGDSSKKAVLQLGLSLKLEPEKIISSLRGA